MTEENAPQSPEVDNSMPNESPEKAHVMAQAGNEDRTEAISSRQAADLSGSFPELDEEHDPDGRLNEEKARREETYRSEADGHDAIADMEENRAGEKYDTEQG